MKAIRLKNYSDKNGLVLDDISDPVVDKDQVLVEIHAASLNPFDIKLISGYHKDTIHLDLPITPGGDFSGVITKIGDDVIDFQEGNEVYGTANVLSGGSGSWAEYASVKNGRFSIKPKNLDHANSAGAVLVGVSAVQSLEEHMNLKQGQKILIHGGAGGIGHMALQLAKHIGAYVAATVSKEDLDFAKKLGADEVIDYKNTDFAKVLKNFDAVFVTVGGDIADKSFSVLKPGGILVTMVGQYDADLAEKKRIQVVAQKTKTNRLHLDRLTKLLEDSSLVPHLDRKFTYVDAPAAIDYYERKSPRGKIVLDMKI